MDSLTWHRGVSTVLRVRMLNHATEEASDTAQRRTCPRSTLRHITSSVERNKVLVPGAALA